VNRALAEAIVNELSAAKTKPPVPGIWHSFDEQAWDKTLNWLDLSGLALYLRQRLEKANCLSMVPPRVRQRLDRCEAENIRRAAAMAEELKVLNEMFTGAGIEHVVLKGIAMVPDYCPHPAMRTQYDHDLMIRADAAERTEAVLRAAGYKRKNSPSEHPIVYCRPEPNVRFAANFMGLYSPRLGRSIELHVSLWESSEDRIEIDLTKDLFARAVRRRWQDFEYLSLNDEDALVFQVLHAFRHVLRNWCRLSVFLEIAYFLNQRSSDSLFWKRFTTRIGNLRWVPEATVVVFGLAELLFGASIPEKIKVQFSSVSFAALALWVERYGRSSALANFRNDKYSLFLHREFVEDPAAWAGIRRQRLFPTNRPHRPPVVVFQRGFSRWGKLRIEAFHALRRLKFHAISAFGYAWEYPKWLHCRRTRVLTYARAAERAARTLV
jgi:hypothetical protein